MSGVAFLLSLDDKLSPAAKSAAGSLADLDASLKKDTASLRTMESALKRLQATEGASQERIDSLTAAIGNKKAAIGETTNSIADYSEGNAGAAESTGMLSDKIAAMGGPWAIAATVAAALGAALLYVGAAMVKTALSSASMYRSQVLLNTAMSGSAESGAAMTESTYRVSRSVALAGDKVQDLAGKLSKAGLSGKTFETSLKNLANVASVAGDQATAPIAEIIEKSQQLGHLKMEGDQLKGTGLQAKQVFEILSKDLGIGIDEVEKRLADGKITAEQGISALNQAMENKFGALSDSAALDFDSQIAKAKEGFAGMFRDVNIEPFLQGLKSLLSLLDESTPSGAAMKSALTGAMNGFFSAAAAALPYVKQILLGIGIAALKVYISMKPAISAIGEFFSSASDGDTSGLDTAATIGEHLGNVFMVLGVITGVVFGAMAALVAGVIAPFVATAAAAYAVIAAVWAVGSAIGEAIGTAVAYLEGLDFGQIATDLIQGLVDGINNGTGMVISAISGLGSSAIGALKSTLGIASPSKVFAGLGGYTAEGFSVGLDDGSSMVEDSLNAMVELPTIAPSTGATGAPASMGGGSFTIQSGAIVIQINGAQDSKAVGDEVESRMGLILTRLAEQQGVAVAA